MQLMMDQLPNELMVSILSFLDVTHKFQLRAVSRKWKQICEQILRKQKRLTSCLYEDTFFPLPPDQQFDQRDLVPDSLVREKNRDCWPALLRLMPGLTGVQFNCEVSGFIRSLLETHSETLKCLICPNWSFRSVCRLPQLQVIEADCITSDSFRSLIQYSELVAVKFCRCDFRDWHLLPVGLISLTAANSQDVTLDAVFSSGAASTLRTVSLRSDELRINRPFTLPEVQQLELSGDGAISDNEILSWAESFATCKQLQHLKFSTPIDALFLSSAVLWDTFFSAISEVSSLYLNLRCHKLESMSQVIASLSEHCLSLEELTLPYANLNDSDMRTLSRLPLRKLLVYSNSGPVTERGIMYLLTGECADSLEQLHLYNNYHKTKHEPSMTSNVVKQKLKHLSEVNRLEGATLQYLNEYWTMR